MISIATKRMVRTVGIVCAVLAMNAPSTSHADVGPPSRSSCFGRAVGAPCITDLGGEGRCVGSAPIGPLAAGGAGLRCEYIVPDAATAAHVPPTTPAPVTPPPAPPTAPPTAPPQPPSSSSRCDATPRGATRSERGLWIVAGFVAAWVVVRSRASRRAR